MILRLTITYSLGTQGKDRRLTLCRDTHQTFPILGDAIQKAGQIFGLISRDEVGLEYLLRIGFGATVSWKKHSNLDQNLTHKLRGTDRCFT